MFEISVFKEYIMTICAKLYFFLLKKRKKGLTNRPIRLKCGTIFFFWWGGGGGSVRRRQNVINWSPVGDVLGRNFINRRPIFLLTRIWARGPCPTRFTFADDCVHKVAWITQTLMFTWVGPTRIRTFNIHWIHQNHAIVFFKML